MKYEGKLTVLAGCLALLVGAAHAQSPARDAARDNEQAAAASDEYAASLRHRDYLQGADLRASQIVGAPVKNMEGENLGEIQELVIGEGNRMMVVLGVGGFLGVGEKRVAVPYDELRVSPDGDTFFVNRTRAALENEPAYVYRERTAATGAEPQLAQRAQTDRPQTAAQANRTQTQTERDAQSSSAAERAAAQRAQAEDRAERSADAARDATVAAAGAAAGASLGADDHRASTLIGAQVVDSAGQNVGKIDDLVVSSDGDIQAVLSIGGLAGIGDKLVAVPFDDLQIAPGGESANEAPRLRIDMTAQQARESLPEFRYERRVAQGSATSPRG